MKVEQMWLKGVIGFAFPIFLEREVGCAVKRTVPDSARLWQKVRQPVYQTIKIYNRMRDS